MVQTLLRILLIVFGVGVAGWLLVAERAFRTKFASFTERASKAKDSKPAPPSDPDKILV